MKKPVFVNGVSLRSPLTGVGYYTLEVFSALARRRLNFKHCEPIQKPDETTAIHTSATQIHLFLGDRLHLDWTGFQETQQGAQQAPVARKYTSARSALKQKLATLTWLRAFVRKRQEKRFQRATLSCKTHSGTRSSNLIYHEPNFIAHPFDGPKVVTVHDFSFVRHPQTHPASRVAFMTKNILSSMEQADRIVLISDFVQKELQTLFGEGLAKKSIVIPNGVSARFRPRDEASVASVLQRHGLAYRGFLLSVGTLEPRKNLVHLLQAYADLPSAIKSRYPLILAGPKGWQLPALEKRLTQLRHEPIRWLGYLESTELAALYASARAFAYLSIYEGFGLPVLEAMASATPVLASDAGALTELVGDAGLITPSCDPRAIQANLQARLLDDSLWKAHQEKGLARAKEFSWSRAAQMLENVYEELS